MGKLERITIALPEEMVAQLRTAVEAGEFASEGEMVFAALRDWSDGHRRRDVALAKMRAMIDEALEGPFVDGPSALAELRAKYRVDRD